MHGGERVRAQVALRRPHARLRPRRPHDDAAGRRALPARDAQLRRHGVPDLPARRGRLRRRQGDDRRTACSSAFPPNEVYALHNWPGLPPGTIGITPGPAMAAADRIEIDDRRQGRPRRASAPDDRSGAGRRRTSSPRRRSIVSRNVSPIDTAVVSLCAMQAGDPGAMSVIPAQAKLVGTVRTFRPATQDMIERRLTELVQRRSRAAFGATATLHYERIYPATINHDREAMFAARRRRSAGRRRQRGARPRPVDGRGGFFLHAAGQARRVRAPGPGRRRRRLLPAQQPLRLQRRGDSARRRLSRRRWPSKHAASAATRHPITSRKEPCDEIASTTCSSPRSARSSPLGRASRRRRRCGSPTRAMRCRWTRTRSTSRCS